jgi:hypothetical protein
MHMYMLHRAIWETNVSIVLNYRVYHEVRALSSATQPQKDNIVAAVVKVWLHDSLQD